MASKMKIFILFGIASSQDCTNLRLRRNIYDLNQQELVRYINATRTLHFRPQRENSFLDTMANVHYSYTPEAHGVPAFLPWHREFLRRYELELQRIDPNIMIPYWDWSRDSQAPERSKLLSTRYFGGNIDRNTFCLTNGAFLNWQVSTPSTHCLQRNYNGGSRISSFYSPEAIEVILRQSKNYEEFHNAIEGGPHNNVHNGIGGDMQQMFSPNDPIFYLHHAFIDRLWWEWQVRNPNMAYDYNGKRGNGMSVSSSDNMNPFNIPVYQVFSTETPGYCYTYERYSGTIPRLRVRRRRNLLGNLVGGVLNTINSVLRVEVGLPNCLGALLNLDLDSLVVDLIGDSVNPFDRNVENKIRTPAPIPDEHIRMNRLNPVLVRNLEDQMAYLIAVLNRYSTDDPECTL